MQKNQVSSTNLVEVGYKGNGNYSKNYNHKNSNRNYSKNYNHNYNKHYNNKYMQSNRGYHYGNRNWGHRYNYRPYGWQTLGCIAVGPIWYCP